MPVDLREAMEERVRSHVFVPAATLAAAQRRRRRRVATRAGVLAVAAIIAATGVTWLVPADDQRANDLAANGRKGGAASPLFTMSSDLNSLPAGQIIGTLERRGDCLVVNESVLVMTATASWDADSKAIVTKSGKQFAVGSDVSFGGGYGPLTSAIEEALGKDQVAAVRSCLTSTGATTIALADAAPLPSAP